MPDVVIAEPMDEAAVALLAQDFDVLYEPTLCLRDKGLCNAMTAARALIVRNRTVVWQGLLDASFRLRVIGHLGIDTDNIDVALCRQRGIAIAAAAEANDPAVAQFVFGGMIMLVRGAYLVTQSVAAGAWPRYAMIGEELTGKRLGLLGFNGAAARLAELARCCGMEVVSDAETGEARVDRAGIDAVIATADVLSLHLPLRRETRGIVDRRRIAGMKPGAIFINSARGALVDEAALIDALRRHHLGGALIDVFETEPLPVNNGFQGLTNVILTPHVAGLTRQSAARAGTYVVEAIRTALTAEAPPI